MVRVDWGDLRPSAGQRARVQASIERMGTMEGPIIGLRKCGMGYEARLQTPTPHSSVELRLHDADLGSAMDRLVDLLSIVKRSA